LKRKALFVFAALLAGAVFAQESEAPSKDEIAKELANPNTVLTSLKLQSQYFRLDSDFPKADGLEMYRMFLQPTLPFPLKNGKTLWVRPGIQYIFDQPVLDIDSGGVDRKSGLGDSTLDVQYGATLTNGFLWSVGFSAMFPTASEEELGTDYWTLGPGFQLGVLKEKSILGVFANHQWDVYGDGRSSPDVPYLQADDPGVSLSSIQLFGVLLPGNGWSVGSTPIMTYNHKSSEWMVPLNLTASKTFIINGRPWEISIDLNYYVERPDSIATEWMFGLNIAPVMKNVFAN